MGQADRTFLQPLTTVCGGVEEGGGSAAGSQVSDVRRARWGRFGLDIIIS